MKRSLTSLVIENCKSKPQYHLMPGRMAIIKRQEITNGGEDVGYKLVQALWKIVLRILKKMKIELLHDPTIPLLGLYPKETQQ